MTKKQFDDLYLGKAVHCDTEEKANKFLELAHGFGYSWGYLRSLLDFNYYYNYREKTCYLVDRGGFEYSPEDFYIEQGYKVVEFKQETFNILDLVEPCKLWDLNGDLYEYAIDDFVFIEKVYDDTDFSTKEVKAIYKRQSNGDYKRYEVEA